VGKEESKKVERRNASLCYMPILSGAGKSAEFPSAPSVSNKGVGAIC